MTREQLKEKLWQLRCLLDELDSKASHVTEAIGVYGKGSAAYDFIQEMNMTDALEMYGRMTSEKQTQFRTLVNNWVDTNEEGKRV